MTLQKRFADALLDPQAPVPAGVTDPEGHVSNRRFSVYRNNVTYALIKVLRAGFPCVEKLVGTEFFDAMAAEYLRQDLPKTPILMLYGAGFAEFLADFPPVASLGYLPDIARLEQALRESYHSADAPPMSEQDVAKLMSAGLDHAGFVLAPALRVITSDWPVYSIWAANMADGPKPSMQGEDLVVLRPRFDPVPQLLPKGGGSFIRRLALGDSLSQATADHDPTFDLATVLQILIAGGALVDVKLAS